MICPIFQQLSWPDFCEILQIWKFPNFPQGGQNLQKSQFFPRNPPFLGYSDTHGGPQGPPKWGFLAFFRILNFIFFFANLQTLYFLIWDLGVFLGPELIKKIIWEDKILGPPCEPCFRIHSHTKTPLWGGTHKIPSFSNLPNSLYFLIFLPFLALPGGSPTDLRTPRTGHGLKHHNLLVWTSPSASDLYYQPKPLALKLKPRESMAPPYCLNSKIPNSNEFC